MDETLLVNYRLHGLTEYVAEFHSHQEYEIYIFHGGSCRYIVHNHIYDLEPGDILLLDGKTLHKPNIEKNSDYVRSHIHFSPHWIKDILAGMGSMYLLEAFEKLHHCLIRTKENPELKYLEAVVSRLAEIKRTSPEKNQHAITEMKVLLLQVLIIVHRLGQHHSIKMTGKKMDKAEHAENIAEYIQKNYMNKLSIQTIAEALNLSKSYAAHVFKEMTGFTIMEYVMGCRLNQVKYLLEIQPDKPLKEIAHECGFESVSHFSRYFREKVGVTAKEYRQSRIKVYG
ncbi:AraC family transcriptional regulator [Bacillus sp. FJAT-27251]|uniref:AraC family transcriptional regulator n=1 Tax=Bacillus sp. FJAT-27251 TaxID=1684142 RepID=UPI0006A7C273|nr:AraC family transcriptional regulator [Bacillus sp. FJAT-27251]